MEDEPVCYDPQACLHHIDHYDSDGDEGLVKKVGGG